MLIFHLLSGSWRLHYFERKLHNCVPDLQLKSPVDASATAYNLRAYKKKAEKRAEYEGGKRRKGGAFVFATISVMMEQNQSLTMKIVRSGSFPLNSMVNLFFARDVRNKFQAEIKKRF